MSKLKYFFIFFLPVLVYTQQLAFPTAIGAGAYATGGRGYPTYKVTSLDNAGNGTFRQALLDCEANGGGNIVFDVSGTILLTELLYIDSLENVTIAGQTAPTGGIAICGTGSTNGNWNLAPKILINSLDNVIWRYVRFRQDLVSSNHDNIILNDATNFIIDHCSFAFGTDEGLDTTNLNDIFTIQYCAYNACKTGNIVGNSSNNTYTSNASFINNYFYNTSHRFPNLSISGRADVINNLAWNYVARLCEVQGEIQMNHINNYYASIYGELDNPADGVSYSLGQKGMLYVWDGSLPSQASIYTSGNILTQTITDPLEDNWEYWHWRFNVNDGPYSGDLAEEGLPRALQTNTMYPLIGKEFTIRTAEEIKINLVNEAGANKVINDNGDVIADIDSVDQVAITNITLNNQVYYNQIFNRIQLEQIGYAQDFWDTFSLIPINIRTTNSDGIPAIWATANIPNGLTGQDISPTGYTYFENYINSVDHNNQTLSIPEVTPQNRFPIGYKYQMYNILGQLIIEGNIEEGTWYKLKEGYKGFYILKIENGIVWKTIF
jgi:hypothetical protein